MKKITQTQISNILNCEVATVSRYLSKKRSIKLDDAVKVALELNVPLDIFLTSEAQIKYFGKSFIKNFTKIKECNTTTT